MSVSLLQPAAFLNRLGITLSLVEKYLLKHGWRVRDVYDDATRVFLTLATREAESEDDAVLLRYPKPTYRYEHLDIAAYCAALLDRLAELEAVSRPEIEARVRATFDETLPGYACRQCGHCCRELRDAHQGRVSYEEVEVWRALGLGRLLSFVNEEKGQGYSFYTAWVHPKKGKHFRKCPWLCKVDGEARYFCRIHAVKPLKCRAFPLWREQAERVGCPGVASLD